jgi:response regulator RpfG family c-di-GMP phosphodiesterase
MGAWVTPLQKSLLDRLLSESRISAEQRKAAWQHAKATDGRVEDSLVELGILQEGALLKWIAALFKTRFVSTEKLSKAEIDRATLQLVPRDLAERLLVFPVVFDGRDKSLAVVLADPDNREIPQQVKLAANVNAVKGYIARPAAIRAAIQKHYAGDIHAFGRVDKEGYDQFQQMMSTYERNVFTEEHLTGQMHNVPEAASPAAAPAPPEKAEAPAALQAERRMPRGATIVMDSPPRHEREGDDDPFGRPSQVTKAPLAQALAPRAPEAPPPGIPRELPMPAMQRLSLADSPKLVSSVELVNVLVSLLENQRQELRGHSALVSRLMQKVAEHMGLDGSDVYAMRLAGLLHDVGKTSSYHLTALNVAEYEGHRTQAQKCFMSPVRLFEAAGLPKTCVDALTHVYERVDGRGFPDRRAGKDIALGARLLAIAETYADLTSNARNPFRKTLTAKAAVEVLGRYKDRIFDANLVDLFRVAALGEDMQSSLLGDRPRILLVDADAEETTVLELRLVERGFEVVLCRTAEQAYKRFQQGGVDAVIAEVDLKPHDGFTLVQYIRKHRTGAEVPVLFVTRRSDRASVDRGLELGAADYIIKPAAPDVVVAKAENAMHKSARERAPRGVSGSLSEMPLPDVLQVLSRTGKTGLLRITSKGRPGEIQFGSGAIHQATFGGRQGSDAVYAMLALAEGEFELDPAFVPARRVIHDSTEQLLLEGMRRMDEATAGLTRGDDDLSATRVDEG